MQSCFAPKEPIKVCCRRFPRGDRKALWSPPQRRNTPCRKMKMFIRMQSLFAPKETLKVCCRRFPRGDRKAPWSLPQERNTPCSMLMLILRIVGQSCPHRAHRGDSVLNSHAQRALDLSCTQRDELSQSRSICFIAFSAGESSQRALGEAKRKEFGPRGLPQTPARRSMIGVQRGWVQRIVGRAA